MALFWGAGTLKTSRHVKNFPLVIVVTFVLSAGCASSDKILGTGKENLPAEFNQRIRLEVSENYEMHQAPRSRYDIGDLQSFHTQHTLPTVVEDTFKRIFREVEVIKSETKVESAAPDIPALFEVRIVDLANDIYNEADSYRAEVTLAVAMKDPDRDTILWQKAFRGEGYVGVDPQFTTGLGPQDAVLDAMQDALMQMKEAMISSTAIRNQLRGYLDKKRPRPESEVR